MEDDFIDVVNNLYKNERWYDILKLNISNNDQVAHSLLWVWPSQQNLKFIGDVLRRNHKQGVISIGCGSGLFEWLLNKSNDIPVIGIEIDRSWWCSKYSKNKYIPLKFISMPPEPTVLPPSYALFFCYFNNGPAFKEYIQAYGGDLVFIVGPGKDRGTLTNPEPFNPDFSGNNWSLIDYQEVKNTGDFIAAWKRTT